MTDAEEETAVVGDDNVGGVRRKIAKTKEKTTTVEIFPDSMAVSAISLGFLSRLSLSYVDLNLGTEVTTQQHLLFVLKKIEEMREEDDLLLVYSFFER